MSNLTTIRTLRAVAGGALLLFATLAQAQYVWVDDKGVKQFSDRPPPPSVPTGKILKAPGQAYKSRAEAAEGLDAMLNPKKAEPAASAAASTASAPAPKKGPLTTAEQNAEFKKRQTERAEAEKKEQAEAEKRRIKAENCETARAHKAQLDSGERLTEPGKDGERNFITDAQRAERQEKANRAIAAACN